MSVLVNGSPSEEFGIERGVRQGDPLSPFLFILAAEGLNAIVNEAVEKGIFRGVKVGANHVMCSHLQYADDTIFFGEWNKENAKSLMCVLRCFEEVSGLRVNYAWSWQYGSKASWYSESAFFFIWYVGMQLHSFVAAALNLRSCIVNVICYVPVFV
ncbi:ribonuclease H protein [Artemisia annua]|uniref:Ribonuclease H protein n=1 Tax=Artemisia annua TaxID=35608 RepID=A0A2U1L6U6_ARTAN|nr:ribonuclease H protein [Artemisia annua]